MQDKSLRYARQKLKVCKTKEKLKVWKTKEHQWQHKLKTFKDYGGLNIREERRQQITSFLRDSGFVSCSQ